jgi:ankyrin repeat protein
MRSKHFVYGVVLSMAVAIGSGFGSVAIAAEDEGDRPPSWIEQLFGRDYSIVAERHTLSGASEHGMVLIAQSLLDRGVDINTRDGFGRTPLIRASQLGNMQMVRYLLDHEADFRLEDYSGYTALHWAIHENRPEVVRFLVKRGADPSTKSSAKISPFDVAKVKGRAHILPLLAHTQGPRTAVDHSEGHQSDAHGLDDTYEKEPKIQVPVQPSKASSTRAISNGPAPVIEKTIAAPQKAPDLPVAPPVQAAPEAPKPVENTGGDSLDQL